MTHRTVSWEIHGTITLQVVVEKSTHRSPVFIAYYMGTNTLSILKHEGVGVGKNHDQAVVDLLTRFPHSQSIRSVTQADLQDQKDV